MFLTKRMLTQFIILGSLILVYLLLQLIQIDFPCLFCDEAIDGVLAIQILKNYKFSDAIKFFNKHFPLMMSIKHSALTAYLTLPFFYLFGIGVVSLRLVTILFGSITIILTYLFVKEFFNVEAALVTILLLIINSTFLIETKMGIYNGSIFQFASIGSLFCFFMWYKQRKSLYLYLAMFLLGFGLSIKIWFIWFIMSLCMYFLFFRFDVVFKILEKKKEFLLGILSFVLGSFLILYYNLITNFSMIRYITKNLHLTEYGFNNYNYLANFFIRLKQLFCLTNSPESINLITRFNHFFIFLIFCLLWLLIALMFRNDVMFSKKRIKFLLFLFFLILLQSPFTITDLRQNHLFILYPFLHIILGVAVIDLINFFKKIRGIIIVFLLFFIFLEINKTALAYNYIYTTAGKNYSSEAIYKLAEWLRENKRTEVIAVEWGISDPLLILTKGEMDIRQVNICTKFSNINITKESLERELTEEFKILFKNKNNLYVFAPSRFSAIQVLNYYEIFKQVTKELALNIIEEKRFNRRDGQPIYVVYSIH